MERLTRINYFVTVDKVESGYSASIVCPRPNCGTTNLLTFRSDPNSPAEILTQNLTCRVCDSPIKAELNLTAQTLTAELVK